MAAQVIGWVGMGRMGYPMAERLLKAGHEVRIWNRTRAKAEPLAEKGATLVDSPADLADVDVFCTMVSTGKDVEQVYFGENGVLSGDASPAIMIDWSSISTEESASLRERVTARGSEFLCAPVSGNGKCVKSGKLSSVVSGPKATFDKVEEILSAVAPMGVAYVGDGELARFCKIAHNVMLGVVIQNLAEITILAEKAGVPRVAFLDFINNSVMGSIFTRYKTNALVNLDWTTTFTPQLLRKDLGPWAWGPLATSKWPMPDDGGNARGPAGSYRRARSTAHDPEGYLAKDFAMLLETVAAQAGMTLDKRRAPLYATGLEVPEAAE